MPRPQPIEPEDKNRPLRKDIRLLGRILGDKVPEQSGDVVFDTVERIRQSSVGLRRDEDVAAQREFEATLNDLPPKEFQVIRAFFRALQYCRGSVSHSPHPRPRMAGGSGAGA